MRLILCFFFAICLDFGCHQAQPPQPAEDVGTLNQRFIAADGTHRSRLNSGIGMIHHKAGQALLVEHYWQGHKDLVCAVVDSVQMTHPDLASQVLVGLMAGAHGEAKTNFEAQLIHLGPSAVDALMGLGAAKADWQTMMPALHALGKIKAKKSLGMMTLHLQHPNDWLRIAAAHALGDLGMREGIPALMGALKDTSDTVVSAVLVGLGKIGDRAAISACAGKLTDNNARVRAAAVGALGRLGGDQAEALLKSALRDLDPGVVFKAKQALEILVK
jgi:hypothetical protein